MGNIENGNVSFPCQAQESALNPWAVCFAGSILLGSGVADGEITQERLNSAAVLAEKLGQPQAATYIRTGESAVIACAMNRRVTEESGVGNSALRALMCPVICETYLLRRKREQH